MREPHVCDGRIVDWPDLVDELDRWRAAGRVATLWWRDDDAVAPSPRLDRMLAIAGEVPVALAVIPALAEAGLAATLEARPRVGVVQHGWRHANHAGAAKKSEYPPARWQGAVAAELAAGRERLSALFGARSLPVLAPPWNRIDDRFLPLLGEAGLQALSRKDARRGRLPAGLGEANVHADLVAWRTGRGFVGAPVALAAILGHLQARRRGEADAGEPTGILTHHLVADCEAEEFLSRLVATTCAHAAARWLGPGEVFGSA